MSRNRKLDKNCCDLWNGQPLGFFLMKLIRIQFDAYCGSSGDGSTNHTYGFHLSLHSTVSRIFPEIELSRPFYLIPTRREPYTVATFQLAFTAEYFKNRHS